jgi:hypothetical protein
VTARAAGAITPLDLRRLDVHLEHCERCRGDLASTEWALDVARLPPISDLERKALAHLPTRALTDLRRERVGTPIWKAFAVGFAAAAAIAVVIAAPTQVPPRFTPPGSEAVAAWQEPDPDELLALLDDGDALADDSELVRAERLADAAVEEALADAESPLSPAPVGERQGEGRGRAQ